MSASEEVILRLSRAVDALDAANAEWVLAVRAARAENVPLRTIASIAGVSPQTVANILARIIVPDE